jgi:hypothetical protein
MAWTITPTTISIRRLRVVERELRIFAQVLDADRTTCRCSAAMGGTLRLVVEVIVPHDFAKGVAAGILASKPQIEGAA